MSLFFVAISVRQMLCKSGKNVSPLPGIVEETQADNVKQEKTFAKEREREREARTFVLAASKLSDTDQKSRKLWQIKQLI